MSCLDEEQVVALLDRRLPDADRAGVEAHLDVCDACRTWVAKLARDWYPVPTAPNVAAVTEPAVAAALDLRRGMLIGRYMLLETLGAGGMGMVFAAYDPELDRKIAIKLLRPEAGDPADAQQRLLAEGKAMARLQHPNVVAVHDVGTVEGRVFVALEYVEGKTLAEWLEAPGRGWRDVLRLFLKAGEGLAAAHAVGIVHRDFKPSNVLVGADGRARVCDFGLAHEASVGQGTPLYMAPERRAGASGDARADQYSFCVALRDALQTRSAVPRRLTRALERGLCIDPSARWPSMAMLLTALKPPRRAAVAWGTAAAVLAIAAAIVGPRVLAAQRVARCASHPSAWSPERAGPLAAAFEKTGLPFAPDAWSRTERRLDSYAKVLAAEQQSACEAAWERGQLPEDVLLSRLSCLERDRRQLAVLVGLFAEADAELVGKAVEAVTTLPRPELCAQLVEPDPPGSREVREQIAEAQALTAAGRYQQAEKVAAAALLRSKPLESRLVEAEAELAEAKLLDRLAKLDDAEAGYVRAARAALAARADALGARAAVALVFLRGVKQHHAAAGREAALEAAAWVERSSDADALRASLLHAEAGIDRVDGKYAEATQRDRRACKLRQQLLPPEPLTVAESHVALASDLRLAGKYDEALVEARLALELQERQLGPDNPGSAASVMNVAILLSMLGKTDEALASHRRVLELRRRSLPKDHPETATALLNLGTALSLARKLDEALPLLEEAAASGRRSGVLVITATAS